MLIPADAPRQPMITTSSPSTGMGIMRRAMTSASAECQYIPTIQGLNCPRTMARRLSFWFVQSPDARHCALLTNPLCNYAQKCPLVKAHRMGINTQRNLAKSTF